MIRQIQRPIDPIVKWVDKTPLPPPYCEWPHIPVHECCNPSHYSAKEDIGIFEKWKALKMSKHK